MSSRATTGRSAFSLLELLIGMVMLITLSVVFLGGGRRGGQERKLRQCEANLQKIHIALTIYANDHDGDFPRDPEAGSPAVPLSLLAPTYTADTDIFICPGTNDDPLPAGGSFAKRDISYAYYMGWRQADPGGSPLLSDRQITAKGAANIFSATGEGPGANHYKYGGNILFLDGSTRRLKLENSSPLRVSNKIKLLNPETKE